MNHMSGMANAASVLQTTVGKPRPWSSPQSSARAEDDVGQRVSKSDMTQSVWSSFISPAKSGSPCRCLDTP